jgi:hypothetical protein
MMAALAQTTVTSTPPLPRPQFFAGTVTELDAGHITVSRTLVGHAPESRIFQITSSTKMNRSLIKVKSRVTVRYRHLPAGDVALDIQLRPSAHPPRSA